MEAKILKLPETLLNAKIQLLDKQVVGLQQDLNESNLNILQLSDQIQIVQYELDQLKKESLPMRAKSILSAAETRFLELLLDNSDVNLKHRYPRMDLFLDELNILDEPIKAKYQQFANHWNASKMAWLFRRLSYARGAETHKEDREPEYFRKLDPEDVRSVFSDPSFGFNSKEVELVVQLHALTWKPAEDESEFSKVDEDS